jgi:hypothetical protein
VDREFVNENARELERMRALVKGMTDKELGLQLYKEGWTVAAALGHIAFWDERRLLLVRKWKKEGIAPSAMDETILNDALVPFLLQIPVRRAAEMTLAIAEDLDRELESLSPDLVSKIEQTGDRHALNRGIHRKMHLDDIEALLKAKRGKP